MISSSRTSEAADDEVGGGAEGGGSTVVFLGCFVLSALCLGFFQSSVLVAHECSFCSLSTPRKKVNFEPAARRVEWRAYPRFLPSPPPFPSRPTPPRNNDTREAKPTRNSIQPPTSYLINPHYNNPLPPIPLQILNQPHRIHPVPSRLGPIPTTELKPQLSIAGRQERDGREEPGDKVVDVMRVVGEQARRVGGGGARVGGRGVEGLAVN